jgi:hypothetical protein
LRSQPAAPRAQEPGVRHYEAFSDQAATHFDRGEGMEMAPINQRA